MTAGDDRTPLPAPGWYPDAQVPGGERWWDGGAWGEQRRPAQGYAGSPAAPRRRFRWWIPVVVFFGVILLLAGVRAGVTGNIAEAPQPPSGFTGVVNGVAWVMDGDKADAGPCGGTGCFLVKVQPQKHRCSAITVDLAILDANHKDIADIHGATSDGAAVGDTVIVPILMSGGLPTGAADGRVTGITCAR